MSATLMPALRAPVADGLKVTLMVQPAFGASEELPVQVPPPPILKSDELVPVIEIALRVSVAPPMFVTVTACAALALPTNWLEKANPFVGVKLAIGGVLPVPVRLTD